MFVKAPRAGGVKTRLAVDLGPDVSAAVYRALAEAEIEATRPRGAEYDRLFLFTPAEAREEMAAWLPGEMLAAQDGSDLGARMAAAFEMAFERGADQVAIIGTDVPWVSRDTVGQAFAALSAADVAIGPCQDGGYYLLALSQPRPELFSGIAWSTSTVCAATLDRTRELGLRSRLLGTLPDVDTLADLRQSWDELRPLLPPAVAALLEPRLR